MSTERNRHAVVVGTSMAGPGGAVMTLVNCPDCGEIAEVVDRFVLPSTDGPVEHVRTCCVYRHWFITPLTDAQTRR
jgi:hypothetical protein